MTKTSFQHGLCPSMYLIFILLYRQKNCQPDFLIDIVKYLSILAAKLARLQKKIDKFMSILLTLCAQRHIMATYRRIIQKSEEEKT